MKCKGNFLTCDSIKHTCSNRDVCFNLISLAVRDGVEDTRITFPFFGDVENAKGRKHSDRNPKRD